ncbi:hypothetical protein PLICRDRAFT_45126 [Plicaturopsis crispa FD-325 SS-3]|uniref:SUN domain-containing protein n=1 Tax=Plicaturopsis crispa FD-325 SS-3 TaxID=944288 RepID=A0A0C9SYF2_PLICR|nr:hypothetical protein PLICRDRAFT_45126 [Plicaturopsis crispa FD-325 SS-3]
MLQWIPHRSGPAYTAPEVPAANIAELSARLQTIENALSGLSLDHQTSRSRQDKDSKVQSEIAGRLGVLESRVQKESARAVEAEEQFKAAASKGLQAVKQEIETLQAQVEAQRSSPGEVKTDGSDEEARVRLKALEERVGSVEGGVKEALDLGKQSVKAGGVATSGAAWWNKLASGSGKSITIKSSDGQDVTSLIGHLVDTAVSKYSKDNIARPDFAAYSSGGQIIPSLSSPTYEMRPHGLRRQLVGLVTGHGYAVGRPPVTALNHETHNGHCWPFPGTQGQLGVVLTAPAYIEDITIDHVAKEVALDMRSAPREMEVWAMIDGADNIRKVKEWRADKARRRQEAEEEGLQFDGEDEPEYPRTLPKSPQYLRIANFTYDIHAPQNIQTFPVSPEIRALGVDFGIVVLRVMSNWGRDEFTCLYRFRVHGQMMGEIPLPYPESAATA